MKRSSLFSFLIALSIFFCATLAHARRYAAEVAPQIGYLLIEGDSDVESDLVYGGRFGISFNDLWAGELSVLAGKMDIESTSNDADVLLPTLEAVRYFGPVNAVYRPYIAFGGGYLQINRDRRVKDNDIDAAALYGAGVKWHFLPQFLARLDGRHIIDMESGEGTNNALISLGLSWIYGGEEPQEEPAVVAVAPVVVEEPVPLDSDKDSVTDDKDECPETAIGTAVDAVGCPLETHVIPEKEWVLKGVTFKSGSNELTADSMKGLEEAVEILKTHSRVRVEIQGNTDRTGSDEVNVKLSQARAEAVKTYLVGRGISADRLETRGLGFTNPIDSNKTPEGRAKNRRIEFKVLSR